MTLANFVAETKRAAPRKRGRPPLGNRAMTVAERSRRYRKHKVESSAPTWSTPPHITAAVLEAFKRERFCLDPASPDPPVTPCRRFYSVRHDGLAQSWSGELVWCNPPYGRGQLQRWIFKAIAEHQAGDARKVVLLVPARMETEGMCRLRDIGAAMLLLRRRLAFGTAGDRAPWASLVAVLGADAGELEALGRLLPDNRRIA